MLTETEAHFQNAGYWKDSGRLDRKKLALEIADELKKQSVLVLDDIERNALAVFELRTRILGASQNPLVNAELDGVIGALTSPKGPVQRALDNGDVLCATSVSREVNGNGGVITIKRTGRFVTENPDIIERYCWTATLDRYISAAHGANVMLALTIKRQPALGARRAAAVNAAHTRALAELPQTTP